MVRQWAIDTRGVARVAPQPLGGREAVEAMFTMDIDFCNGLAAAVLPLLAGEEGQPQDRPSCGGRTGKCARSTYLSLQTFEPTVAVPQRFDFGPDHVEH